jgi:CDP-diglyceride synthetase
MVSPNEMRNGVIGAAVSLVIVAVAIVFFGHADRTILNAIGVFAFISAFVVAHTLDALERRRERDR